MYELLPSINAWIEQERPFAVARVIKTWGSSPRPIGSAMIISEKMEMAGSVSGGCVENEVVKAAQEVIQNGASKMMHFGISDEDAWTVGLSCGGKLDIFIQQFLVHSSNISQLDIWDKIDKFIHSNHSCILITKLEDGCNENTLLTLDGNATGSELPDEVIEQSFVAFEKRRNEVVKHKDRSFFVQLLPRKNLLLIIGAAHISADLVQIAKLFNFQVIVIDPRGAFSEKTQFTVAPDQIIENYPSEVLNDFPLDTYTYAAVLSHDPKIDDNALDILLKSDVAYIGALGSRKTQAKRIERLKALGYEEEFLAERIDAPIGVNINAKTPQEIALSIISKIIEVKNVHY